jgi:LPS O-antigen subunit length determinant protein (WzzB/FepE family)
MNQHMEQPGHPEEIDLADLLVTILRHKWYFVVTFAVLTLAGIYAAIVHTPKYEYSVSVQIGQVAQSGQASAVLIEDPKTATAKITGGFIPQVLASYRDAHPEDLRDYKIDVSNPDNSNVLVLSTIGTSAQQSLLTGFLTEIGDRLVKEENRQTDSALKSLQQQLTVAQNKIKTLGDQIALTGKQIKGTNVAIKLAGDEMARLKKHIEETTHSRDAVIQGGSKADKSFTLLLLNNELINSRSQLFDLANTHDVTLPQQRATLNDQVKSIGRQITEQEGTVSQIQAQIEGVVETHTITPPLKSLNPVGFSRWMIVALAMLAGVFLGFAAVFIAAMGKAVQARMSGAGR